MPRATITAEVLRRPVDLHELFAGLKSDQPRVKYGCAKALRLVAERAPATLYPHYEAVADLLESDETLLRWAAILMIGDLAAADVERRFDRIARRFFAPIAGPVMITAANTVKAAARVARARPEIADTIVKEILAVDRGKYRTPMCREIAVGHALTAMEGLFDLIQDRPRVVRFARKHLRSSRPATRKKAGRLLRRAGR